MSEDKKYTLEEAHRPFAVEFNGRVWELLEKPERSKEEDERMIHAAHASCHHWLFAGTGLHHQRGEWLIARVYTVLGREESALRHAQRCLELTEEHADLMEDFDYAFAYECMARANALAGREEEARKYLKLAEEAGAKITDEQDKEIFLSDFNAGEWYGVK